jgi:hypothetical protein
MKWILPAIILISSPVLAGEVTEFEDRPASVQEGEDTYIGILLSEGSYRKVLKDVIDRAAEKANCTVDKRVCEHVVTAHLKSVEELREIIRKRDTWFERNKGSLGFVTGIVSGALAVIAVVKAVYPGQ